MTNIKVRFDKERARIRKLLSEEARARAENENEAQAKTVHLPKRNRHG